MGVNMAAMIYKYENDRSFLARGYMNTYKNIHAERSTGNQKNR